EFGGEPGIDRRWGEAADTIERHRYRRRALFRVGLGRGNGGDEQQRARGEYRGDNALMLAPLQHDSDSLLEGYSDSLRKVPRAVPDSPRRCCPKSTFLSRG